MGYLCANFGLPGTILDLAIGLGLGVLVSFSCISVSVCLSGWLAGWLVTSMLIAIDP